MSSTNFPTSLDDFEDPVIDIDFITHDVTPGSLIEVCAINGARVLVKFARSIKTSTIINANISLLTDEATPIVADDDPFEPINLANDFDSISQTLLLRWNSGVLDPEMAYSLHFKNFRSVTNEILAEDFVRFATGSSATPSPDDIPPVLPPAVTIIDYSLVPDVVDPSSSSSNTTTNATDTFTIIESDPINFDAFLPEDYNNGVVTIRFSLRPDAEFVTSDYIVAQKKPIQRRQSRWASVPVQITQDPDNNSIYIAFPSTDASPLYDTSGAVYYEKNVKYRIRLSSDIGSSEKTLGSQQFIEFAGEVSPVCIDPEELTAVFPDSNYLEITEAIRIASVDAAYFLKLGEDECSADPVVDEYIKAAAACMLSRIYGNGSLEGPGGDLSRVQLGDFTVQKGSESTFATSRSSVLPINALTWCELAAALKNDINMRSVGFKAVVKGSDYDNPIPRRHFSPNAGDWPPRHRQGDLDDPPFTKNWRG